jgi:hypothetical protein
MSINAPEPAGQTILTPSEYSRARGFAFFGERGKIDSHTMHPSTVVPSPWRPQA